MLDILGLIAGGLTSFAFLPQAIKTYRTKSADDLSMTMFILFFLGLILWLSYGILKNDLPIILTNLVTLSLAGFILVIKIKNVLEDRKSDKTT